MGASGWTLLGMRLKGPSKTTERLNVGIDGLSKTIELTEENIPKIIRLLESDRLQEHFRVSLGMIDWENEEYYVILRFPKTAKMGGADFFGFGQFIDPPK